MANGEQLELRGAGFWKRYAYSLVTLGLFVLALAGHWVLGWYAYVDEQAAHGQSPSVPEYLFVTGRDTLENWQSEFLQLVWQIAGLAYLLHVGSPQSKEGVDRLEAKVDEVLRKLDPKKADAFIADLDRRFGRD